MNPDSLRSVPPEQLLARTQWLRRLARHLLEDPHEAEDAVQDVMVAALDVPVRNWRGWLSRVLRRTAGRRRENEQRRRAREAQAIRSRSRSRSAEQTVPPTDEIVAQAAMQRKVVDSVLEMHEPYRSAILLRYWADLSPKEVATRQGVPLDTVYSRLRRGLEMLRTRLGTEDRDWRGALLPFVFGRMVPWSAAAGVASMSMSMPLKVATGAACAFAAILFWTLFQDPLPGGLLGSEPEGGIRGLAGDVGMVDAGPRTVGPTTLASQRTPVTPRDDTPEKEFLVRGVVRLFHGTPLSRVKVRAMVHRGYETEGDPEREEILATDEKGRFEWRLETPGETVVLLFRSGQPRLWNGYGRRLIVRGSQAPQDIIVQATPLDIVIRGRVLAPDGEPVAGALVRNPFAEANVHTGPDGRYQVPASSVSSDVVLFCRKRGFALAQAEVGTGSKAGDLTHDFHLQPGVALRGKVVDADDKPIAGVRVRAVFLFGALATSDERGAFAIEALDPTRQRQALWFHHREFLSKQVVFPTAALAASNKEHRIVLERGVRIEGRVFGIDGTPLAGVELRIAARRREGETTVSRDDGSFVFQRAQRGRLQLTAKRRGLATAGQEVRVPADVGVLRGIAVRMEREQVLAGRLVDDQGRPLAEAGVVAWQGAQHFGEGGRTDKEGRFRLRGLPTGRVRLEAFGSGVLRQILNDVEVGQEDLRIVLQRSAGFAGRVLDARSGKPVSRFKVRIVPADRRDGERAAGSYPAGWADPGVVFHNRDGTWSTAEIGSSEFRAGGLLGFEITADGYAPCLDRRVTAHLDPKPADFEVRLLPAAQVHGRVVDAATGNGVAGATVRVTTTNRPLHLVGSWYDHSWITTRSDGEGRFSIPSVPVGMLALRVEHSDHPWHLDGPFPVQSGQDAERLIRLSRGCRLGGFAPASSKVHLFTLGSSVAPDLHAETRTDGRGRFQFAQVLEPGDYLVYALAAEREGDGAWRWFEARVAIRPDDSQDDSQKVRSQEIQLRTFGTACLRGRPGDRWRQGRFRPAGVVPWVEIPLTKGVYDVRGLRPGRYDVHGVGEVEVKADRTTDTSRSSRGQ